MPSSFVIILRARSDSRLPYGHGHALHAWYLSNIAAKDERFSALLHAWPGPKPFALSLVYPLREPEDDCRDALAVSRGDQYWFRLGVLDEQDERAFLPAHGSSVRLLGCDFEVEQLASTGHPFAFAESYETLAFAKPAKKFLWRFHSPTAIRAGNVNLPLPMMQAVVRGLLRRWNQYASCKIGIPEGSLVAAPVLARYRLETSVLPYPKTNQIGFVGECLVDVQSRVPDKHRAALGSLFLLAGYTGVGYKTTMGMGLVSVERIDAPRRRKKRVATASA